MFRRRQTMTCDLDGIEPHALQHRGFKGRLLDAGCGTGAFAMEMQRRRWTVAVKLPRLLDFLPAVFGVQLV
jgi:2-polyprenyl-3-methyl-5-hydroxy-6-metoxy-1,4-benzoquinol methylase